MFAPPGQPPLHVLDPQEFQKPQRAPSAAASLQRRNMADDVASAAAFLLLLMSVAAAAAAPGNGELLDRSGSAVNDCSPREVPRPGRGKRLPEFSRIGGIHQQRLEDRRGLFSILRAQDDGPYVTHLRMSRSTFLSLVSVLEEDSVFTTEGTNSLGTPLKQQAPVAEQLVSCLYYMAHKLTYNQACAFLGIPHGTLRNYVGRVARAIVNVASAYVHFPCDESEIRAAAEDFYRRQGVPGCVGVLDGTRLNITNQPKNNAQYQNLHYGNNIAATVVCDGSGLIIYAEAGYPGRMHDSTIFRQSEIFKNRSLLLSNRVFLMADAGYALAPYLMTPFKEPDLASCPRRRTFNKFFCGRRAIIERVIGHLKGRWQILSGCSRQEIDNLVLYFKAAVVLHNFCLLRRDIAVFDDICEVDDHEILEDSEGSNADSTAQAKEMRASLVDLFNTPQYVMGRMWLRGSGNSYI